MDIKIEEGLMTEDGCGSGDGCGCGVVLLAMTDLRSKLLIHIDHD